jgi:hypothetical protein
MALKRSFEIREVPMDFEQPKDETSTIMPNI